MEPDPLTLLFHRLIRYYNGDDLDPFTIGGYDPERERLERHCFYYSVVMDPNLTLLFDNDGRGGMCDVTDIFQVGAIWRTTELLANFETTFEALQDGTAVIGEQPVPRASFDQNADLRTAITESTARRIAA